MKVLWVSNSPIGPAAAILDEAYVGTSGGWIQSEYEGLQKDGLEMFFLCTSPSVKKGAIVHKKNNLGEVFCLHAPRPASGIPNPRYMINGVKEVVNRISPDLIQIWGTETCLSNVVARCAPDIPKVIFIQGLIGVHERYLGGYFNTRGDKFYTKNTSIIAMLKQFVRKRSFINQAAVEQDTIRRCKNVIIDSEFAEAYCQSVGSDVCCYKHPLLPNNLFYNYSWNVEEMNRHTIFTVFGSNAEKGLQQLLKAVNVVKREYPDVCVLVPGSYPLDEKGQLSPSRHDAYYTSIKRMIDALDLKNNIRFLGRLDAAGMAAAMSRSHAFVNPSCMEVHALSLRECLVQGIPCISTLCGGVLEFVEHKKSGLIYRYEEYEMLAAHICAVFSDDVFARELSENAKAAMDKLNTTECRTLNEIYQSVML